MALKKVEMQIPEELLKFLGKTPKEVQLETLQRLVLSLIHESQITASKGAELLNMSYQNMTKLMEAHDVPFIRQSASEVDEDVKTLKALLQ